MAERWPVKSDVGGSIPPFTEQLFNLNWYFLLRLDEAKIHTRISGPIRGVGTFMGDLDLGGLDWIYGWYSTSFQIQDFYCAGLLLVAFRLVGLNVLNPVAHHPIMVMGLFYCHFPNLLTLTRLRINRMHVGLVFLLWGRYKVLEFPGEWISGRGHWHLVGSYGLVLEWGGIPWLNFWWLPLSSHILKILIEAVYYNYWRNRRKGTIRGVFRIWLGPRT